MRSACFRRFLHRGSPVRHGFIRFGTALGMGLMSHQSSPVMKTNLERALRLKKAADRMMIEGNVERHLHAMRLLFTLRRRNLELGYATQHP